jgi:PAS domain S-box-containing protein
MAELAHFQLQEEVRYLRSRLAECQEENFQLRQSEARFRLLADATADFVILADRVGNRLYVSPSFLRATGYSLDEVLTNDFRHRVHPDDVGLLERAREANLRGEATRVEYRCRLRDGSYVWLDLRSTPVIGESGEVEAVVRCARDISDRKFAEQALREIQVQLERRVQERTAELMAANARLSQEAADRQRAEAAARDREAQIRVLVDSLPAFVAFIDHTLRFRLVNRQFESWSQRPVDQIVGNSVREVVGERIYARAHAQLMTALAGQRVHFQWTGYDATGKYKVYDISVVPYQPDESRVDGFFVMALDVTELKLAEERVRQLQADLAHVGRLNTMGEMASALAHELNQPLAAIANYVGAASFRLLEGESSAVADLLRRIGDQAERAGEVTRRLRAFVSRTPPHRAALAINDGVHEALQLLGSELQSSACSLHLELPDPLPQVWADHIQIVQVLVNLIRNALEAMGNTPPEGRELTIRTGKDESGICVRVSDSGGGIAPEMVERLFFPFHTSKVEGMGMGLAISRSIIDSHGGRIWAENNPAGGATFGFTLPAAAK